jgi:hypothetical protein
VPCPSVDADDFAAERCRQAIFGGETRVIGAVLRQKCYGQAADRQASDPPIDFIRVASLNLFVLAAMNSAVDPAGTCVGQCPDAKGGFFLLHRQATRAFVAEPRDFHLCFVKAFDKSLIAASC